MKKKILTLALVIALLAIMVGGSLAYFTAEDEVTNTFTVGSVKIEIYENGKETPSDVMEFKDEPLVPVVNMETPSSDPGYIPKVVTVRNTGVNAAFIRTHIAIPTQLVGYLYLDLNTSGWNRQTDGTAKVDGVDYTVFTYDYHAALASGQDTTELLKGAYLGSKVDLQEDADGDLYFILRNEDGTVSESGFKAHEKNTNGTYTSETVSILVASQAIQAQGFEKGATDALNTGFPAHPWAN